MGNLSCLNSGFDDAIGFERSALLVISFQGIRPWSPRDLVNQRCKKRALLAKSCPFRMVPVMKGIEFFTRYAGGWYRRLTRERFVDVSFDMMNLMNIQHTTHEQDVALLVDIFESIDCNFNGELSFGEWAAGLTIFFDGKIEDSTEAVFRALGQDGDGSLTRREFEEYVKPFVEVATPPDAEPLRPLLIRRMTGEIWSVMDFASSHRITFREMLRWNTQGNNILDRLTDIIEHLFPEDTRTARKRGQGATNTTSSVAPSVGLNL
mmetsp:Transcript_18506/g.49636  ORF Transcript_18506/g.49636 Transcript_18506/m.49636 type:complete len:264 (-) Transcript_18506:8-799(-)